MAGRRKLLDSALVFVFAVAVYSPALHHTEFTFDDQVIVANNPRLILDEPGDLLDLAWGKYWGEVYAGERLWRPVPLLSFAFDRALFGPDPDAFHRTNVLLHALVSLCALLLAWRLGAGRGAGLLAALLFAVHPVHAEAVAGVVGRSELLALLFALVGMLAHLEGRRRSSAWLLYGVAPLSFLVAFASKEIALSIPFILLLTECSFLPRGKEQTLARWLRPYLVHGLGLAVYFACRMAVLGELTTTEGAQTIGVLSFPIRILVAAEVSFDSLSELLWPGVTSAHYSFSEPSWGDPLNLAKLALTTLLLIGSVWLVFLGRERGTQLAGLGLLGYFLSLAPVSNLLVPIGVVRADRLLYTPSFFFCLGLAACLGQLIRTQRAMKSGRFLKPAVAICIGLLLGAGSLRLHRNVAAWVDNLNLWETSLERFPEEPRIHLALGDLYLDRGRLSEAEQHLSFAVEHTPLWGGQAAKARASLAANLIAQDRREEAGPLLSEARRLRPGSGFVAAIEAGYHCSLAEDAQDPRQRELELGRAEAALRRGLQANQASSRIWLDLGTVLSKRAGREEEAARCFAEAIARGVNPWEAFFNRARLRRLALGDPGGALEDLRQVTRSAFRGSLPEHGDYRQILPEALLIQGALAKKAGQEAEYRRCWELLQRAFPEDWASFKRGEFGKE